MLESQAYSCPYCGEPAEALLDLLPRATLQVASTRAEVDRWPAVLMADVEMTVR